MKRSLRVIRALLAVLAMAGALLLFTASEAGGWFRRAPIYITPRADSTIRTGYDTAQNENAFCAIVTLREDGDPWILGALQAQVSERSPMRVVFYCPPTMVPIHWHLDGLPNTKPDVPSRTDSLSALCYQPVSDFHERPLLHLVYWKSKYIVYGVRGTLPDRPPEDICGQR